MVIGGSMDSILNTIKKMLGIVEDLTAFDEDIKIGINSAIFSLSQIGVGPSEGYSITGASETWSDYLGDQLNSLQAVKNYIFLKTRIVFDPPTVGAVMDAYKNQIAELEWRLNVQVDDQSGGGD